jgi:hypothetical protein
MLADAFPNGDPSWYDPTRPTARVHTTASEAQLAGCCQQLGSAASVGDMRTLEEFRTLGCCSIKFEPGHCTPWGPPTPPQALGEAVRPRPPLEQCSTSAPDCTLDLRGSARVEAAQLGDELAAADELAPAAIATWRGRMVNEHGSARVFDALAMQLEQAGLDDAAVATCRGFADEERNHGVLCGAVVEALGGQAIAPELPPTPFPLHTELSDPLEAALRNVLAVACLSETVAVALIGAEREEMPDGRLRALLTRIWSDEIGHARFGWQLLGEHAPRLDAAARARLGLYLQLAFAHLEAHELSHLPADAEAPPGGPALGLCTGRDARELFYATIEQVILPGLEHVGLPARSAWQLRDAWEELGSRQASGTTPRA